MKLNTFVVSDIHLADAEPPHPHNPLWKKFKRPEYFIDESFSKFLDHIQKNSGGPAELVLNGDIFDFDSVMALPKNSKFHLSLLERRRGLNAEEEKSLFKIQTILNDHKVWIDALAKFLQNGNSAVFVIGNHDIELHWPSVQKEIAQRLGHGERIRFVEWFYISGGDTLIEHGNQYDPYSLCTNPINPVIKAHNRYFMRLPFGNLAGKYMLNGMGLMNPHSESSYIKSTIWEYVKFFYRYVIRSQPFIIWNWLASSLVSLYVTVSEGLKPAVTDPLTIAEKIDHIAAKSNATTKMVLSLRELHAHPAAFNPLLVLQELWLDRAILFGGIVFVSFEFYLFVNAFHKVSILFFAIPLLILLPIFIFYARGVRSQIQKSEAEAFHKIPIASKITNVKRTIHGHTHIAKHCITDGVEYLNTGTWSPAFLDVECTQPYGKKCFAWIRPDENGKRIAELFEWRDTGAIPCPKVDC